MAMRVDGILCGDRTVHVGDSLHLLSLMPDGCIDVVVTSPPYNIGIGYRSYSDRRRHDDYISWMTDVSAELYRVVADEGSLFLNVGGGTAENPWLSHEVAAAFAGHWKLQNRIVWVKSISVEGLTHGHFKPVGGDRFLNRTHEDLYHLTKSGHVPLDRLAAGVPYKDKTNLKRFGRTVDRRCDGNTWFIPYDTVVGAKAHPAAFPVELPLRCILLHGVSRTRTVLDPFMGSGSTLVAALRLGLVAIGLELDPTYAISSISRASSLPPSC